MKFKLLVSAIALAAFGTASAADYKAPRTEWDQPDLQGVWNFASNVPMTRPALFGDSEYMTQEQADMLASYVEKQYEALNNDGVGGYNTFWVEQAGRGDNLRTSLITYPTNGQIPERVEGVVVQTGGLGPDIEGERPVRLVVGGIGKDSYEDRGISERCIVGFNSGPPFTPSMYNNNIQIVQNKDTVVIMTEMIHDARIVPLNKEAHIDDDIRLWTGDSRGYWDGDSLVVETRNFNGLTNSFSALGSSENKHLTERFTRVANDRIDYEFTIDDPSTFSDKIVGLIPIYKVAGQVYEYACHEGNYGMVNILRGARVQEQLGDQ